MKIDRSKLKKSTSEVPFDCQALIERLKTSNDLLSELQGIKSWNYGKCELYHWVDVLDRFDGILEEGCSTPPDQPWRLSCDQSQNTRLRDSVHSVLTFTALLIEHSFSRHLYSSVEHLTTLLASSDMNTVLAVLNLVYVFSKRSNFLIKLGAEKRQELFSRLTYLAESWGGKENGFGLAECCRKSSKQGIPPSATTLHFEFYSENSAEEKVTSKKHSVQAVTVLHLEHVDQLAPDPVDIMEDQLSQHNVPKEKLMLLFTHIRLAHCFSNHQKRLQCVQARLQALSVLVYSSAIQEISSSLLYSGLIEELVDVLQLEDVKLVDIKSASLRTLTSIIHLDRNPELISIIDATGAASYHGFLPVMVRQCIQAMIDPNMESFPHSLATSLFSFLYHLASYETGGEALVSCGMMESLLKVIKWPGEDEQLHTTFVTRAVRVVDLITNLDMAAFQTHGGLSTFINRLEHEIGICRRDVPYVIKPTIRTSQDVIHSAPPSPFSEDSSTMETDSPSDGQRVNEGASTSTGQGKEESTRSKKARSASQCFPQRAALLKSMLNFLKKAIQDPSFSDSIRHVMDGSLPSSLKHIISNAEYYSASLFLLACELVTVYVFQEPSLLSSLQDTGLTDVMLHALLIKDVPATKEVLGSLPNIFSALCLNSRGLDAFNQCKPFEKLFKVLLSPVYLPAMRRRRTNDALGDTASSLGSAMDELMRHQPSLKDHAMSAIIKLMEDICSMGHNPNIVCSRSAVKAKTPASNQSQATNGDDTSSDDEDEEDEVPTSVREQESKMVAPVQPQSTDPNEKTPVPLMDYILNVMKFVEAILCNNATDDHCWEFVSHRGLEPLLKFLRLPNLPIDFPTSSACQSVASVCKAILSLARESGVLKEGLLMLKEELTALKPLQLPLEPPGGSILLRELVNSPNFTGAPLGAPTTPLLRAMVSAHSYVTMLVHVCRVGQTDVRTISVNQWGSDLGQEVLRHLSHLYISLVWESIVLLALFTPGTLPEGCELGKLEREKLLPKDFTKDSTESTASAASASTSKSESNARTSESDPVIGSANTLMDVSDALSTMEVDDSKEGAKDPKARPKPNAQMLQLVKQAMPVLYAPSRLGKALSELFGLLVKLCVGSSVRQRSRQHLHPNPSPPSEAARNTAKVLMELLLNSLSWTPPPASPLPKFRVTFYICAVSFASPMLFDEKKNPYHLMLQKFVSTGAHAALFDAFHWAVTMGGKMRASECMEHPDLPEGTGEFIDAWLSLIEKLVNPESVLDSPHSMPAKGTVPGYTSFNPVQFLINTHKSAFNVIMNLWGCRSLKSLGNRTAESLLAILCHIVRGESVIAERVKQAKSEEPGSSSGEGTSAGGASTSSGSAGFSRATRGLFESGFLTGLSRGNSRPRAEPNEEHIRQLMDMGFPREHAVEALQQSTSLERAAEWALTHPPRLTQALSEEEEMMQAIALSLGEAIQPQVDQQEEEKKKKEEEERKKKEEEERKQKLMEEQDKIPEEAPLDKTLLNEFVDSMLPGCLKLLDDIPETVYRVCDLLVVANNRNGTEWRDKMLEMVINQISENAQLLCNNFASILADSAGGSDTKVIETLSSCLASRIHLLCLLFEEIRMACAQRVEASNILDTLITLLYTAQKWMAKMNLTKTPKWMGPALLLIDLYEKTVLTCKRKVAQEGASHTWKWFDDSTGRWCTYSRSNNKTIDDAYWAGKPSVKFTAARRRYVVHFSTMIQVNEETMNKRPIMQALPTPKTEEDKGDKKDDDGEREAKKLKTSESLELATPKTEVAGTSQESKDDSFAKEPEIIEIQGLGDKEIPTLIRACVGLIGVPVDPDTMHAVLRICLRFTRDHSSALLFAELGGPSLLLSLTQASSFNSFPILANLLLRHVFEEKMVLQNTMDKLIYAVANKGVGCNTCNVALGSVGCREMNFVLRKLGPLACRDQELFLNSAKGSLKIALPPAKRGEEDETRFTGPNALQLLKASAPKAFTPPALKEPMLNVLCNLLDALIVPMLPSQQDDKESKSKQPTPAASTSTSSSAAATAGTSAEGAAAAAAVSDIQTSEDIGMGLREIGDRLLGIYSGRRGPPRTAERLNSVPDGAVQEEPHDAASSSAETSSTPSTADSKKTPASSSGAAGPAGSGKDETSKSKPLIPKSAILRLLAELVMSYSGIAQAVAQYQYTAGQTKHVKEFSQDGTALAYILDHLLPQCQKAGDKDCPGLAQVLLASIAASNHSPDAQMLLVTEIKGALGRALTMPESSEKHSRIQALTMLISVMIEACPSSTTHQSTLGSSSYKNQLGGMNIITRLLLRKGLVTDLARVPHSLDLSSPNMASTVNSALKPLETLSRIVNHPPVGLRGIGRIKNGAHVIDQRSSSTTDATGGTGLLCSMDAAIQRSAQGGAGGGGGGASRRANADRESVANVLGVQEDTQDSTDLDDQTDLECIVDELLDRSGARAEVLGETLIATGPERLGSLRSAFVDQAGEASQDEMVITMTDDGEEMDQSLGDAEMRSQHSHDGVRTDIDADDDSVQDEDSAAESDSDDGNEDRQDEGEEDEEDEEDDEEEEEEDEEDHDDGSEMDAEDYDITEDLDYFRVGDRDEDMWVGDTDEDMLIQLDPVFSGVPASIRTYQLPVAIHEDTRNANDVSAPNIPVPPSVISASHPLLVRHSDHTNLTHGVSQTTRNQRVSRQRVNRHGTTQTVHIYHSGPNRPPNVQNVLRLLGLSSSTDIVQLTTTSTGQGNQTRVYVANSGEDINQNREEVSDIFEEGYSMGYFSGSNFLSVVPPVYRRWDEESKVLDGRSVHDCVQALKPGIISVLEKHRDEELAERREKRRKQAEEDAKKKAEEEAKKKLEEVKKATEEAKKAIEAAGETDDPKSGEETKEKEENMEVGESSDQPKEAETATNLSTTTATEPTRSGIDMGQLVASVAESALGSAISSALSAATLASAATTSTTTAATTTTASAMAATPIGMAQSVPSSTVPSCIEASSPAMSQPGVAHVPQLVTVTASSPTPTSTVSASQPWGIFPSLIPATPPSSSSSSTSDASQSNATITTTITTTVSTNITTASTATLTTAATSTTMASAVSTTASSTSSSSSALSTPQRQTSRTTTSIFASLIESDMMEVPLPSLPNPQGTSSPAVSSGITMSTPSSTRQDPTESPSGNTGMSLPEGVDPSFLAALPENIRQEVLQEHLGIRNTHHPPAAPPAASTPPSVPPGEPATSSLSQVNPEFLAALPPHIQEEVLAQERAEQQRHTLAAQSSSSTSAPVVPAEPVDPAAFIQNLPPGLRQTVLADMDDSVLAVLPADIAAEAQALRLDRVLRHRQLMQDRLLRETGLQGRLGHGMNYYRLSVPRQTGQSWGWGGSSSNRGSSSHSRQQGVFSSITQNQGRQLVDLEALTCLLVLLFVNEPKLNLVRLLRVLRNLSFHQPTRQWILQALLSIMERTKACKTPGDGKASSTDTDMMMPLQKMDSGSGKAYQQPSWLSISMDAALGCRASVFKVQRSSKKSSDKQGSLVCIHPQVAPMVCRHVMDALLALAKEFPYQFIPISNKKDALKDFSGIPGLPTSSNSASSSSDRKPTPASSQETSEDAKTSASDSKTSSKLELDFWDLLVRLDNTSQGRKGKVTSRPSTVPAAKEGQDLDTGNSALSKLMAMLSHPVVKRSTALTDKLLHLLSMVTSSLPDGDKDKNSTLQSGVLRRPNPYLSDAVRSSSNRSSSTLAVAAPSCGDQSSRAQTREDTSGSAITPPVGSPMDTAAPELPNTQNVPEEELSTSKTESQVPEKTLVDEDLLQLAVEVLTAHTCSEDGLEDATTMLMQLSRGHGTTREAVLKLLLKGAQELGQTLCRDIMKLYGEVKEYRSKQLQTDTSPDDPDESTAASGSSTSATTTTQGGYIPDRFNPTTSIVINAPTTGTKRSGFELRLQSMGLFTGKTSNQNFLLRMLKVIIQLREVAKKAKRVADIQRLGGPNIAAAVAALETNATELMQMMSRRSTVPASSRQTDRQNSQTSQGASGAETSSAASTPSGTTNTTPVTEQPPPVSSTTVTDTGEVVNTYRTPSAPVETPMEVDSVVQPSEGVGAQQLERQASTSTQSSQKQEEEDDTPQLSELLGLEELWDTLSTCLTELSLTTDNHAVLVLQPAVEAFFLVHASDKDASKPSATATESSQPSAASSSQALHREGITSSASDMGPASPMPSTPASGIIPPGFFARESSVTSIVTANMPSDTQKFLRFAEKHRNVLNQILRQSTVHLSEGPFSVLVNHVRILDFDVKRRYFRQDMERSDEGMRREDMAIHVRREHVFEDSYRELHRRTPEQWKNRFYVVFEGEEGQDAGGLLREWYLIISKEIFNQMYALFRTSPGDRVTYIPNPSSHCNSNHLSYFKFVGRIIAKAIYDNKLLECYFSRSFYKHILGKPVKYTDMESEDYAFYQGLVFLLEHEVSDLGYDLNFSTEIEEFGVTEARDLKPNGSNLMVTEENKHEYVHLVCQMKMTGAIRKQIDSFLEGFYDIIPKKLIGIFNEQELELLIAGLPTIDVDDLKANTEYHKYQSNSLQIQWFWRALRSFDQATRAKFVQFVTGTSKVPLQGFASLEGMNGPQKFQIHRDDRSTDRLPTAHTCFNQLDLPAYETYDKLRRMMLLAIEECTEGFGLA